MENERPIMRTAPSGSWPALTVKGSMVSIIGSGLLRDGRYLIVRDDDDQPEDDDATTNQR